MEAAARSTLRPDIAQYEDSIRCCYEAVVQSAAISAGQEIPPHLAVAGLFLKRVLTDLRTSWLLLSTGYTSPAATIAASLWENALTVVTIANHPECLPEIQSANGDIPWSPQELSKRSARDSAADDLKAGLYDRYEKTWRELYGQYKWLCKIKHPTMRSAAHDAMGASVQPNEYVIMAAPDLRPEDRVAKVMLLSIAATRTIEAVTSFVAARHPQEGDLAYKEYGIMIQRVLSKFESFKQGLTGQLPFHIADEKIAEEYRTLSRASDGDA
jgi:hypothetical protein